MPDLAADIRLMLSGPFSETVTLATGAVLCCNAATADADDALGGDGIVSGQTLVLTVASADAVNVKPRSLLTFRGQSFAVNNKTYKGQGHLTRLFLGAP